MIELTPQQREALDEYQGEPVRVVDPVTRDAYLLVRADVFERMTGGLQLPLEEAISFIAPAMLRAQKAFWRDLPELLKNKRIRGQWVAYHGDERVSIGRDDGELYRECLRRGLQRGEFYVDQICERETPPWVPDFLEQSLFEATDDPPDAPLPSA
jgi:hypothetical protein